MKIERIWIYAALSTAMTIVVAGCHSNSVNAQSGPDPAAANLAQPSTENEAQQQAQYDNGQQPPAPIERAYPNAQSAPPPGYADQQPYASDQNYDQGDEYAPVDYDSLTDEQATEPPPPLPDYDQPPDPDPDYIWTPGYWAWGPEGYYWVPGCWVAPPYVGALWTPGYWGYVGTAYRFHHGYWGRHVGFYGGINYGFGYIGVGYEGGYWNGGHFFYNTAITRVNRNVVRNVYVHNVVVNRGPRVSFNGGRGGLQVRPRPAEVAAIHEQRYAPMQSQTQVRDQAAQNRQQFYSANHGRPAETVAARPVMNDHRMPAELPRAAVLGARPGGGAPGQVNSGNRQPEIARPAQGQGVQAPQARPDFRNPGQQGQNIPRGGGAPEAARPEQQGGQNFPQRGRDAKPVQPQNEVRPAAPQQSQNGRPQFQPRPQQHVAPQSQPQAAPLQQRPQFQPRPEMRQQTAPQPQAPPQPRPQEQMRSQGPPQPHQAPPPHAQHPAPRPQPQHQGSPPQQHDNGHGGGDGRDRR